MRAPSFKTGSEIPLLTEVPRVYRPALPSQLSQESATMRRRAAWTILSSSRCLSRWSADAHPARSRAPWPYSGTHLVHRTAGPGKNVIKVLGLQGVVAEKRRVLSGADAFARNCPYRRSVVAARRRACIAPKRYLHRSATAVSPTSAAELSATRRPGRGRRRARSSASPMR